MQTIHEQNTQLFNDYQTTLDQMYRRAERFDAFFRGRQYSRRDHKLMKAAGIMPIVINILRPLLSNRRAVITSSKPTWKVVPLQQGSALVADACQQYLVGKWNADYLDIQYNLALKDMLITGFGFMLVDLASFLDNSIFDIGIKHVGWRYVFPDPDAKEADLSDAENILVHKNLGIKRAQVVYRLTDEQCGEALQIARYSSNEHVDPRIRRVDVLDRYSKYPIERFIVTPKKGEHLRDLPTAFYTSKLESAVEQERRDLADEMKRLKVDGKIDLREMKDLAIHRAISVGNLDIDHRLMNIRDYPIVSFIDEVGDTFKDCVGESEFVEGIQRAVNKSYSLMLHNAMLQGNFRVMGPSSAVKDRVQFQKTAAIPGAYLPYEADPQLPNGGKPEIMQSGSLPNGFYGLSNDLIQKAQFETNVYDTQLGNAKGAPETFSTLNSLQEFGAQPIKELARRMDVQVGKLGEVVIQFIQNYTDKNELLQFIDLETGEMATPMTQNAQTGEREQIILNQVVVKEAVVSEIKNNTRVGKFVVRIMSQPNLGTDRLAKAAFIRDMLMNKAIPATPTILGMLLKYMEFPGHEKIIADLQREQDAAAQAQQLQAQLKDASEMITMLQNQLVDAGKKVELSKFKTELADRLREISKNADDKASQLESVIQSLSGDSNA